MFKNIFTLLLCLTFMSFAVSAQSANTGKQDSKETVKSLQKKLAVSYDATWSEVSSTSTESLKFWESVNQEKLTEAEKAFVKNTIAGMKEKLNSVKQ